MLLPVVMPMVARKNSTTDVLAAALLAAELGESFDTQRLPAEVLHELFASLNQLHLSVPYATLKLLSRLASDDRVDVRAQTARGLGCFVDAYPKRVEELLLLLACDTSRKVRAAAAESVADLIPRANDPWEIIEAWNTHPDRAREVLKAARRSLPPPLGV
ncbi:MAG: HEAT repeat domain-containing protein [Polyangia bacterium]